MAVTKEKKVEIMNDLVSKFKEAKSIGFATTNTLTVEEFAKLRKNLREVNANYTLAKKTIIKKALKDALNIDVDLADLPGQIGVLCSNDDPIAGLGKANAFLKEANGPKGDKGKMAWAISIFDGEVKTKDETKVLAGLPSRETLLGRLVGSMKSPISALARFFDSASKELEKTGKTMVGELDPSKKEEISKVEPKLEEKKEETTETPKTEEVKEVVEAETSSSEVEASGEEVKTENEEVKEEAPSEVEEVVEESSEEVTPESPESTSELPEEATEEEKKEE